MNARDALDLAARRLEKLRGHALDILTVARPRTPDDAAILARFVGKLSPFVSNAIEYRAVEFLDATPEYRPFGAWIRQDPGFPDAVFSGSISPSPGIEIKNWFPLATEITARFKDSQRGLADDRIAVCMLAWLPERVIFGRPRIVDVCVVSARSVAEARDMHYHNPPDYIVIDPEDTAARARNLQQTNANGYKFQGTPDQLAEARRIVADWGRRAGPQPTGFENRDTMRKLMGAFPYRLDTNFAKMDRIAHDGIETFKRRVLDMEIHGLRVADWSRRLFRADMETRRRACERLLQD